MLDESLLEKTIHKLNSKWYQGDRKYRWSLGKEYGAFHIKRNILQANGKKTFQRLPRKIYGHLPEPELQKLIIRLNHSEDREKKARERFTVESAFISSSILKEFDELLESEIPTRVVAQQRYSHLRKHFLDFFIKKSPNPQVWHRDYQAEWCNYLLEKPRSLSTLKQIIQVSNRFMRFLHTKRPNEIPLMIFKPISKARLRKMKDEWAIGKMGRPPSFINEFDYKLIRKNIPDELKSIFLLCYLFGLRRSEAFGLATRLECVRKDHIQIDRQLLKVTRDGELKHGPTKGRMARKVPYWNSSPAEAYELVQKIVVMTPSDYTRKFRLFLKTLKLSYYVHDCRHTFITDAVNDRKKALNDVKLAAGHTDLRVTNSYLRDNTNYDDSVWVPEPPVKKSA